MTRFVGTPLRGIEFSSPSDEAVSARVVGDSVARIRIDAGGRLTWSTGSSSGDVTLYRDDADTLKTDDTFIAAAGVVTLTTAGEPTGALPDGTIAVDTTNDIFYYRSNGTWMQVSSGASVLISASEPEAPESGDLWFESGTEILYIYDGTSWVSITGSMTLDGLDDVAITSATQYDVLTYNGTSWVNAPSFTDGAPIFSETFGDGSSTEFVISHGFGTRDIIAVVRNADSPYEVVDVAWAATSDTTVTINTSVAPSADSLRVTLFAGGGVSGVTSVYGTANEIEVNQTTGSIQVGLPDNVTIAGTLTVSDFDGVDTDGLDEGAVNLYFTNQRAIDATAAEYDPAGSAATAEANANAYTDTAISNLVDAAPGALDTLNELAAALGDDANFSTTVTNALAEKAPLDSPALTGIPTAPTASLNDDSTQLATTAFVQGELNDFASALDLDSLTDVTISSPANGQVLEYNGTEWVNATSVDSEPIGHEDKTKSVISYDSVTKTFTIAPLTGQTHTVWCKGKRFVKDSPESVEVGPSTNLYYIYYNSSGVLSVKTTYFTWDEDTPTAYVYYNQTDNAAYFFADERHGITLDWATHEYLHRTRGAAIANGFGASNYTLTGNGTSDSHAQLDIANGTFFDEDLQVDITHAAAPAADTWQQVLQGAAEIPVFYKTGTGEWVRDSATAFPLKQGSSRPTYNAYSGGSWTTPDVANNHFGVSFILATNNLNYPIIAVLGQSDYGEKGAAEATLYESLDLDGFPVVEFRPLYKIVYECKDSYSNTPHAAFVELTDLRSIISGGFGIPTVPVSDHGNMTGLDDDDHAQYVHLDNARTISAVHTFSNGLESGGEISTDSLVVDSIEIDTTGAVADQVLRFDGTKFAPGIASTVAALDDLTDVVITSATSGEVLKFDGTNWVNGVGGGGSGTTTYAQLVGNGTSTTFTITHNLGTRDIVVQCRTFASPYESVEVRWEATTDNEVLLEFAGPPSTDEIRAVVYASLGGSSLGAYAQTIGDGTNTSYVIEHALNTRDIVVSGRNQVSPYEVIDLNWEATTVDTVTVIFPSAPDASSVRVTICSAGGSSGGGGVAAVSGTTNQIVATEVDGVMVISLPNDLQAPGDVTVTGNLTVSGTTTTLNTETLLVEDNVITLNSNAIAPTVASAGIEVYRGSGEFVPTLRWSEPHSKWEISNDGTNYDGVQTETEVNTLQQKVKNQMVYLMCEVGP